MAHGDFVLIIVDLTMSRSEMCTLYLELMMLWTRWQGHDISLSTLDAWIEYWQVALDPKEAAKTGFITRDGHYEFNVMPFGLVNALDEFQHLMNLTLHGLTWHTCLVYLDDIIVFSSTFDQHLERLRQVLDRLEQANISLNWRSAPFVQIQLSI
jgi:hypothetical protein